MEISIANSNGPPHSNETQDREIRITQIDWFQIFVLQASRLSGRKVRRAEQRLDIGAETFDELARRVDQQKYACA